MNYSEQYLQDLTKIQDAIPDLDSIYGSSILITGATGLIGSAIIDFLLCLNKTKKAKIKVYGAARTVDKFSERFSNNWGDDLVFVKYDALKEIEFNFHVDYIIHTASPANPKMYGEQPVETMLANLIGVNKLLEYCRDNDVARFLYLSSSEVYGLKDTELPYQETDYGFVDCLNSRSCYPSSKRAAETLIASYCKEFNVDSVIIRPGHIFGPTMTNQDTRAASQFIRDVVNGKDIVMKSDGSQIRSHCYIMDCVSSTFTVLIRGAVGEAYNVSNPMSISTIKEFAKCVADVSGKKVLFENPSHEEKRNYNPMSNSSLDSSKIEALGWLGLFSLEEGVKHTINILSNNYLGS